MFCRRRHVPSNDLISEPIYERKVAEYTPKYTPDKNLITSSDSILKTNS